MTAQSPESGDSTGAPPAGFNTVFARLEADHDDLVGMVAYSLYKKSKREWIMAEEPDAAARSAYYRTVTDTQLQLYRTEAERRLVAYAESVLADAAPRLQEQGRHEAIVDVVRRQQSWWMNGLTSLIASIVFAVLLYVLGLIYLAPGIPDFVKHSRPPATETQPR